MVRSGKWILPLAGIAAVGLLAVTSVAQRNARREGEAVSSADLRTSAGLHPSDSLLHNGWGVSPTGEHVRIPGDLPMKMIVAPDGHTLVTITGGFSNTGLNLIDLGTRKVTQSVPLARSWNGIAFSNDGKKLYATGGNAGEIHVYDFADGKLTLAQSVEPQPLVKGPGAPPMRRRARNRRNAAPPDPKADTVTFLAGVAVEPASGKLYACNEANGEVWVLDPASLEVEEQIPVGLNPHTCVFGADKRHLYVSNWGGRSVSVIDTKENRRVRDINVGIRPNDMALAKDGRLFVACAGDNTVHVIQTRSLEKVEAGADPTRRPPEGTREILSTSLYPQSPEGSTPDGVAVTPDGKTLFVVNADNNDVMVADISDPAVTQVKGFIPTGWYPSAVAVNPADGTLLVGNGKGLKTRPNYPAQLPNPRKLHVPPPFDYIPKIFEGSVSFIKVPVEAELAKLTEMTRRNSPYTPETLRRSPIASDTVIPDRVGDACPIKYVVYVIKENRTYDQMYGDFTDAKGRRVGNGDPNLAMYGEKVTPNHHQLSRDYVLLDNLYCDGEVSVDGHSWCDAAIATDWNQRSWMMSYSQHGKLPGNDDVSDPANGYLWDLCRRHGVPYKCYGEGAKRVPVDSRGTWPNGRDTQKVEGWITDLHHAEQTGELPRFMILSLGENHTQGTTPGAHTPDACVANNDQAIGKLVAAATKSKFWKEMAIFVIEDDAQNGPDHIDAHRTDGLVISPYTRRGVVDSTLYTTSSMVRTMELILGLPPMTQYDAGATPMFKCFQKQAKQVVFNPLPAQVDLLAKNPGNAPGAAVSKAMDFSEYDRAPEDALNRVLWAAAKGEKTPYPTPIHRAVFTKPVAR